MALQISKQLDNGVTATYARITAIKNSLIVNESSQTNETIICVDYWLDKATRDLAKNGGKQTPLSSGIFYTNSIFSDVVSAYEYLKTIPDFAGATDN